VATRSFRTTVTGRVVGNDDDDAVGFGGRFGLAMMNRRGIRSAMGRGAHESCSAYYASAPLLSSRVLRILCLAATAAIDIRCFPRGGYSTFVLNRQTPGRPAVAIVPGGPLPVA